jgi:hypothetical protein
LSCCSALKGSAGRAQADGRYRGKDLAPALVFSGFEPYIMIWPGGWAVVRIAALGDIAVAIRPRPKVRIKKWMYSITTVQPSCFPPET